MNNSLICFILLALSLSSCKSEDDEMPENGNPFMIKAGKPALNVAHRGGRNLKPENTIAAFDHAVALGVDVLEMDVCLTKDSVLVTIHDLTIDRTCEAAGNVIDYTFDELQVFNFGYHFQEDDGSYPYRDSPVRIPSLDDVLARYSNEYMMIEIKDVGENGKRAAEKLIALIQKHGLSQKIVAFSFLDDVMSHFHSLNSDNIFTGAAGGDGFAFVMPVLDNPDTLMSLNFDVMAFPTNFGNINLTSDTIIKAAHRNGAAIHFWTINNKEQMKTLIQRGADGIITDRPDLMKEALAELGF